MQNSKRRLLIPWLIITQLILFLPFLSREVHSSIDIPDDPDAVQVNAAKPDVPRYRNRHALIIGINRYLDPEIQHLRGAVNDALNVQQMLVNQYDYNIRNITILIDSGATKRGIMDALEKLKDKKEVSPDDSVLFYFSGHGCSYLTGKNQQPFLLPYDGKTAPSNDECIVKFDSVVSNQELFEAAKLIAARHKLFIIDAGYAVGPQLSPFSQKPEVPVSDMEKLFEKPVLQFLTAGSPGETVLDSGWNYICFSWLLLEGLRYCRADMNGDGRILASELAAYVTMRTKSYKSRCHDDHRFSTPLLSGMGQGDFVLTCSASCGKNDGPWLSR